MTISGDHKTNAEFTFDAAGLAKCKIFSKYSAASRGSFTEETLAFFCSDNFDWNTCWDGRSDINLCELFTVRCSWGFGPVFDLFISHIKQSTLILSSLSVHFQLVFIWTSFYLQLPWDSIWRDCFSLQILKQGIQVTVNKIRVRIFTGVPKQRRQMDNKIVYSLIWNDPRYKVQLTNLFTANLKSLVINNTCNRLFR